MIGVRQLVKVFSTKEGRVNAIDGIEFRVPRGEFFTLLGPSGCGKSTTLRSVAGLERPDSGEISIGEVTVYSSTKGIYVPTNRRSIGMVFQSYAIWPHMTTFGNVAYPLKVKGLPKGEISRKVESVLELVGLGGLGNRPATRLSGGQQQRVALARALVAEPSVLLLDEPLSNLDAKLRAQMRVELKRLQSQVGITTLYVTHDQQEALAMSDEIAVMSRGKIMQRGTPQEIYHRPRNRFTAEFIGSTNLIEGHVRSGGAERGLNRIETPLGAMLAYLHEGTPLPSRRVTVSVRPEAIATALDETSPSAASENRFHGRVEQLIFLGESADYDVRVGEVLIRVKGSAMQPLAVGTEVTLQMPPEFCMLIADDPESAVAEPEVAVKTEAQPAGAAG